MSVAPAALVPLLVDVGTEVLFFLLLSVVSLNLFYWILIRVKELAPGMAGRVLVQPFTALMALSLLAQPFFFGLTGLERIDAPFIDDRNRFIYFWIAGMAGGGALSFPFHRRRLKELGIFP